MTDPTVAALDALPIEQVPAAIARLAARMMCCTSTEPDGDELLTPDDVAKLVRMSRKWVYANATTLGGVKISREWRFRKGRVERWLSRR